MKIFYRYFRFHLELMYSIFEKILLKTDGRMFCMLFNFKAKVINSDSRFKYNKFERNYVVTSGVYKLYFHHKNPANMFYECGVKSRATKLGRDYLLERIHFKEGDTVIDCGANLGDLKLFFIEKNIPVEYIAIEPSPLEYCCLEKNVKPSQTLNLGLWSSDGDLNFFVSSHGGDSSFIEPIQYDEIKNIKTRRLDSIIDRKIKLLKIEAEGAEPEVLKGCEKLLNKIEWISADLGYERGVEEASTLSPVTNFLLSNNFELVDVNHVRVVALYRNKNFRY